MAKVKMPVEKLKASTKPEKTLAKQKTKSPIPVKIVSTASDYPSAKEDMKYKAKYALEDIERAEGHKRDGELMKHVKSLAREKVKSLKDIC